jgi:hypothetical protein
MSLSKEEIAELFKDPDFKDLLNQYIKGMNTGNPEYIKSDVFNRGSVQPVIDHGSRW